MMNAGRVRHHLFNSIDQEKNTLLIVGYCSPGTPGNMLRNGIEEIKLFGEIKPVKAEIEIMDSFSAHADRNEIIDFVKNQKKLKHMFLVHGVKKGQESLQALLNTNGFKDVLIPRLGQEFEIRNKNEMA